MATPQTKCPPRWRRWFQVSLRTFLVLMLVVSVSLGWLGRVIQRGREQRAAVIAFVAMGGQVRYHKPSSVIERNEWLRKWLGDEALLDVERINLADRDVTNADLAHLNGLTRVRSLRLSNNPRMSDAGMAHLRGLRNLKELYLNSTQVNGAGLVHLLRLTQLDYLDLRNTQVTDADLIHLKNMTGLTYLELEYTQVTDAGLVHLNRLSHLELLNLSNTQVTDDGLTHLSRQTQLKQLYVHNSRVSGAGVRNLKQTLPKCGIDR